MTTSPNEPLEFAGPPPADDADKDPSQQEDKIIDPESELAGPDGYDDRQESPITADGEQVTYEDGEPGA